MSFEIENGTQKPQIAIIILSQISTVDHIALIAFAITIRIVGLLLLFCSAIHAPVAANAAVAAPGIKP